jgi:hypothetical protein
MCKLNRSFNCHLVCSNCKADHFFFFVHILHLYGTYLLFLKILCKLYGNLMTFYVPRGVLYTTLCDDVCQCLAADRWFSPGTPVFSTNKTDRHDITEILLKVASNTITPHYHNYGTSVFLSYWTCLFKLCNLYATFIASWKYENFIELALFFKLFIDFQHVQTLWGRGHRMVDFTNTYAISVFMLSWTLLVGIPLMERGVLDTTLCDKSLSVTCDRSVVFSGFLHQ